MRIPQLRLRTLMIAIAVVAPVFVACTWVFHIGTAMNDFYGPSGKLALEQRISVEISTGSDDFQHARYVEAESRYRSALRLNEDLGARLARHGWHTDHSSSEIFVGLADALAGQHRYTEAEQLYNRILANIVPDHPDMVKVLEHYAASERQMGNSAKVEEQLARAKTIRKRGSARTPGL